MTQITGFIGVNRVIRVHGEPYTGLEIPDQVRIVIWSEFESELGRTPWQWPRTARPLWSVP